MVVHSPYTTWDWHNLDGHPAERENKIERVHETLREVVARAEDEGVTPDVWRARLHRRYVENLDLVR